MISLFWKLLRDLRWGLLTVALLLIAFECLWVKVSERVVVHIMPNFRPFGLSPKALKSVLFQGPGQVTQTLMGGENIELDRAIHMVSIGYVHPLVLTIFCIWAIGRASGAIAGEIDRGTMELLLAQPLARFRLVLTHFGVDLVVIPIVCLSLWAGTWLGTALFGMLQLGAPVSTEAPKLDPSHFAPCLLNVGLFLFAVSGYTMWLSSMGRFRNRVMGLAVVITLVQFVINLLGQLWDVLAPLRPFTVFFYYQPQRILLHGQWTVDLGPAWKVGYALPAPMLVVLLSVGLAGYGLALVCFCRRDLPAPL